MKRLFNNLVILCLFREITMIIESFIFLVLVFERNIN